MGYKFTIHEFSTLVNGMKRGTDPKSLALVQDFELFVGQCQLEDNNPSREGQPRVTCRTAPEWVAAFEAWNKK